MSRARTLRPMIIEPPTLWFKIGTTIIHAIKSINHIESYFRIIEYGLKAIIFVIVIRRGVMAWAWSLCLLFLLP